MRVAAITMAGMDLTDIGRYSEHLERCLAKTAAELAVLPAHSSFILWHNMKEKERGSFTGAYTRYLRESSCWEDEYLELHSALAKKKNIYLIAGTAKEFEGNKLYHTSYCFNPEGKLCCRQRQTHLNSFQRQCGFSRGHEISIFKADAIPASLIVDNDSRHPETGRIAVCSGADLLIHCGALDIIEGTWRQLAGIWSQVQQNQCWGIEAQLQSTTDDMLVFGGFSAVLAPCEITTDLSGFFVTSNPGDLVVSANLNYMNLNHIREKYPLLKLLNRKAFTVLAK